jgi:hypothetical protein
MRANVKRTSLYLDMKLLDEARQELGTKNMTDTIHSALYEVARRGALKRLAEWDFSYLTLERLEEMRRPRTLDPDKHWPGT